MRLGSLCATRALGPRGRRLHPPLLGPYRHVGAQFGCDLHKIGARKGEVPELVQNEQDRRGVGRAAAQPTADRDGLFQSQIATLADAGLGFQQPRRFYAKVFIPENP